MDTLKKHQPAMTIDEQIVNLKSLGLIVKDEDYAKKILNDISYFRLIKAYSLNLKIKNGRYHAGVTFEHIVELYLFDANLRQILFPEIEKIEINLRCRTANYFSAKYGVLGYKNPAFFANAEYHQAFLEDMDDEIRRNKKAPFVKNFETNYEGGELPFYALTEISSFGTLSKFFKNMKNEDKKMVAQEFGVGYTFLESWLESISYVRNICAHYGRLYNAKLAKKPTLYKDYYSNGIRNDRLFAVILCLKQLLKKDSHWGSFVTTLDALIEKYDDIHINSMGFPENWKELLTN